MLARLSHGWFRRHPAQVLLALVGIAAGIAVVTGVALLREALVESLDRVSRELVGPGTIAIRHVSGRIPVHQFAELARTPGAPDFVPVLRVDAEARGAPLELLGVDPYSDLAGLGGGVNLAATLFDEARPDANALVTPGTLELLGLDPGDRVPLRIGDQTREVLIAGVIRGRAGLDRRLLMDIAEVQRLAGQTGWLSELLAPAEAGGWLARNLGPELIRMSADDQRASAAKLTRGMRANLTAMSLLALATGFFVVYSVLSFLLVQRRHLFGLLRAVGMTHRRLARMLLGEVLAIAAFGGVLGLVAGTVLADRLLLLLASPVADVYGRLAPVTTQPDAVTYALIWLGGLICAALVTAPVLREALAIPPGRLVRGRPVTSWPLRWLIAVSVAALASGLAWVGFDERLFAGLGGLFLILLGVIVFIPRLCFGLIDRVAVLGRDSLAGRALRLLASARARLSPALAALSLALALAVGMGMMILGFRDVVGDWVVRLLQADLYVSVAGRSLTDAEYQRLAALPGVETVSSVRRVRLADDTQVTAYALTPESWAGFELLRGDPERAWREFESGRGVLVSEPMARRSGLGPGDRIELLGPEGPERLPVVGVFRDYSSEQGFVGLPRVLYDRWFDDRRHDSVGLYLAAGLTPERFGDALASLDIDELQWITPRAVRVETLAIFDRTFRISWALALLVGLIALIALTSALLARGMERAREHATLRALGLPPGGLFGLVTIQSLGLTAAALLAALPLALLIHVALSLLVQPRAFGWSVPIRLPPAEPVLAVVPLALVAGALAGLYPAWRIGRRRIVDSLRAGR